MDTSRGEDTGGIRRFLEEEREDIIETLRVIRPDAESFLEGAFGQRRQKAILSSIPRIETETRHFGLCSAVETFAGMELKPFNNYNWIDEDGDLTLGAALWILGTLRAAGKLGEAYRLLPDGWGDMDECCLPTDFHHPCFEDDLIRSVMVLITGRYAEPGVITKDNATGSAASDEWEELLKLLPEETVRKACDAFRDKLWDLILRRLRGLAFYELEEKRIISMQDPGMVGPVRRMPERESGEKHAEMLRERFDLEEKKTAYELHFDDYLQMDRRTLRRETGSLNIPDILEGFTVEDPFELCFALFYLIDHGDDAPWLMHTGSSLMEYCRKMLPWYEDKADWDDDRWEIDGNYLDKESIFNDFDSQMDGSYIYTKAIPPKALKLIHKGSGKDMLKEDKDSMFVQKENEMMRFYKGNEEVGGLSYTMGNIDTIISEYEDSVSDFNPSIMRVFDPGEKILNIEDVWVNRDFRGHGLFREELLLAFGELRNLSRQFILRACSDNGFPEDKLVEIYSGLGFKVLEETDEDGTIMGLKL